MNALLVYDVDGWAWHKKAEAIKKFMPKAYFENVRLMNIARFKNDPRGEMAKADTVHIFGFNQGARWADQCSTTIASYYSFANARRKNSALLNRYRAVAAVNFHLYEELKHYIGGRVWCLPNGVDTTIYNSNSRRENKNIVVGWVGKPMWTIGWKRVGSYIEYMGMGGIWPELKNRLQVLPGIEVREVANLPGHAIGTDAMVNFYRGIDVLICTHYKCGTPNPAFEAAACGCCVITTPAGAFGEVATAGGAILSTGYYGDSDEERIENVITDISGKVKRLDREAINHYSKSGEDIIRKNWSWRQRVIPWGDMLRKARYR